MSRAMCFLLCFSALAFAQPLNRVDRASSPSSPVQVLYVIDGTTVITYNINQQTFQPTTAGTSTFPPTKYYRFTTSPNDEFFYYLTANSYSNGEQKLYVYDTNASGVPASTPVQTTKANQLQQLIVNPAGTFLYSIAMGPVTETTQFSIVRNVVNPANGTLSAPVTEATYQLDTQSSGNDCYLKIAGFNPAGTTMYDAILCSGPHGSGTETYNQRSADPQTGALGPDEQIFAFNSYADSGNANVQFANNLMFTFLGYFNQGPDANVIDVYQTQPYSSTPLIDCTASTLGICGSYAGALAYPSGSYVFLGNGSYETGIYAVNLTTQQLVEGNSIPFQVSMLSPDGSVAYGTTSAPGHIRIAGFNAANGEVKEGGSVDLPHVLYSTWFAAERY
jgi:hypothetical protein